MRIDIPGPGGHWVELRDVDSLTAADDDAWQHVIQQAWADKASENAEDEDEPDDGATNGDGKPKPKAKLRLTADMLNQRRDDLLASLVTGWSYADPAAVPHIPLPYSAECRKVLPLPAAKALAAAIKPHQEALNGPSGPKEPGPQTSTTAGSGSGSG
jgi:hypothetical protein